MHQGVFSDEPWKHLLETPPSTKKGSARYQCSVEDDSSEDGIDTPE
jgi:hypothetical protein